MAQLPIVPSEGQQQVKEYPTNAETKGLVEIIVRSAGWPDKAKEAYAEEYGLEVTDELPAKQTDLRIAKHITKGELPDDLDWGDLSNNAISEGIDVFFGRDDVLKNGLSSVLEDVI